MDAGDFEGGELARGKLHEAAAGDAAVRQLRRRYDALRHDYEQLLDRLADIEDQLTQPTPAPAAHAPTSAGSAPGAVSAPGAEMPPPAIAEALAAPLTALRAEYLATATHIQDIVGGLERIAEGALKGQHRPTQPSAPITPSSAEPPVEEPAPTAARPRRIQVDVKGHGFGELLDFQERLSSVAGVARVTINAIDGERATLVVELDSGEEEAD
jgi:hypothetical protein